MIQLYKPRNTNYDRNGDVMLEPEVCTVNTDTWELNITHPRDALGKWEAIERDVVIRVPTWQENDQLYRLFEVNKNDEGVEAKGYPIFFDSGKTVMLKDVRPTNALGQDALNAMMDDTAFSGQSNLATRSTAYYVEKNLMEALTGSEDNSFINRWGGEVEYDNMTVIINDRIGADNGVLLKYGKNIPEQGMRITENDNDVVTRIYPKAYNGHTLSGDGYVDSPLAGQYTPSVRASVITYDDVKMKEDAQEGDAAEGVIVCNNQAELDNALRQKASADFEAGIDKPSISIEADMVMLEATVQYADVAMLEHVGLGDTIHVQNERLGYTGEARVVSLIYDCIRDRVESVVIGDAPYNYVDDTAQAVGSIQDVIDVGNRTVMADRIQGIIDGVKAKLQAQRTDADTVPVRTLLMEDLDPASPTYGATCWGPAGLEFTDERLPDGSDWDWTHTAVTAKGVIADAIITGILSDKLGHFYLNMDTGELMMKKGTFVGNITSAEGTIGGFELKSDGLHSTFTRTLPNNYTDNDVTRIRNIILGKETPTSEDYTRLDINGDGAIDILDLQDVQQLRNGVISNTWTYDFVISSLESNGFINYTVDRGNAHKSSGSVQLPSLSIDAIHDINNKIVELLGKYELGAQFNGRFRAACAENEIGCFRIQNEYIAMYASFADAIANIGRKGWLGYNGATYLTIKDESGGGVWLYLKDGQYVGYSQPSGATYRTFEPKTDNADYLGRVGHRWRQLYAGSTTIATSDRNLKKDFTEFDDRYEKFFSLLKPQLFKFKDGASDRFHVGYISQDVEEALEMCGLTALDFAGFCKDIKKVPNGEHEETVTRDDQGNLEYEYSLRYSEFIALNTHMIQKQQQEIDTLRKQVQMLSSQIELKKGDAS